MGSHRSDTFPDGLATTVRAVMTAPVVSVAQSDTVRNVIEKMVAGRISSLVVVGSEQQVVGMVSASDLLKVVLETDKTLDSDYPHFDDCLWAVDLIQRKLGSDKATEVMSEVVTTVDAEATVRHAAALMRRSQLHHLPVVDSEGRLAGMLSSHDFVRLIAALG
ncbi:CBS domain-containing protein [Roseimaritima ulvae]|uniref:Inosine 5'-monophosphate dehydrogenase n=1 Tax=Roseimaritima ulvae TaxID=980254 RepID=A0A5B9QNL6_9BACT|nr:CBS domain-containing protein [Roseimaritima ulvae]QEG40564.1 inosine 5'-monophosphate dehydrogenase [Roseimaritima ulvae]